MVSSHYFWRNWKLIWRTDGVSRLLLMRNGKRPCPDRFCGPIYWLAKAATSERKFLDGTRPTSTIAIGRLHIPNRETRFLWSGHAASRYVVFRKISRSR